jgi:hypothetical protein
MGMAPQARLGMVMWLDTAWSRRHGQRDSRGSIGEEWQAARGRVRVRQFANWHLTAGMVPQASAPRKWHGRLGSASLGLACFGRQRSMGKDSTPPHGRRRDASQGSICPGMARQEWTGGRLLASLGRQRFARHGETARQATQRRAGTPTHGRHGFEGTARPVLASPGRQRNEWHGLAFHGRQGVATLARSGLASQVKAGMASLAQARQARPGHDGYAPTIKTRQARRVLVLEETHGGTRQARCSVDRLHDLRQATLAWACVGLLWHGRHDALGVAG